MPRRSRAGFCSLMSLPSIVIRPSLGSTRRLVIRSVVVLPQPLGPTRTTVLPAGTSRSKASTATVPSGYRFVTASNVIKPPPGPFVWNPVRNLNFSDRIYLNIP